MKAKGVVVRSPNAPAVVESIELDPPAAGEVLVRLQAAGICHTDLHAKQGAFGREFPYLLGHEGAGVVEQVGDGVTAPAVGQRVVLNYRAPCGACEACVAGRPVWCQRSLTAGPRMRTEDGQPLGRVLGVGTFATHTVVAAGQAIPVDDGVPPEVACLIGCGVVTGLGAAMFAARVRPGSRVAVFGCGAVGMSAIQGAKLSHARQIIAVDLVQNKLEWARRFGATDAVDASAGDPVRAIKERTGGAGVDYAFEAVGIPDTLREAVYALGHGGECVVIGVPHPKAEVTLSMAKLFYKWATIRVTHYGDCLPARDFPLLADWYRDGRLALDELVTERVGLADVDAAFAAMERGETLRSVIAL